LPCCSLSPPPSLGGGMSLPGLLFVFPSSSWLARGFSFGVLPFGPGHNRAMRTIKPTNPKTEPMAIHKGHLGLSFCSYSRRARVAAVSVKGSELASDVAGCDEADGGGDSHHGINTGTRRWSGTRSVRRAVRSNGCCAAQARV